MSTIEEYITEVEDKVERMLKIPLQDLPKVEERNKQADEIIEEYYEKVGSLPKGNLLRNLGTYILSGDLKVRDVDKVTNTEYPILSNTQLKRRLRKQVAVQDDTLDYLNAKYNKPIDGMSRTPVRKGEY